MSLSGKISLTIGVFVGVLLAASTLLVAGLLSDGFRQAEISIADQNRILGTETVDRELDRMDTLLTDWTVWDDPWEFVQRPTREFVTVNMTLLAVTNLDVDLLLFLKPGGTVVWGATVDYPGRRLTAHEALSAPLLGPDGRFVARARRPEGVRGFVHTPRGVMFVVARPILRSDGSGPSAGVLVFGRLLERNWALAAEEIVRRSGFAEMTWYDLADPGIPQSVRAASAELRKSRRQALSELRDEHLLTYVPYDDVFGTPAVLLEIRTDRRLMAFARHMAHWISFGLVAIEALGIGLLWLLLRRLVVSPIQRLTRHVEELQQGGTSLPELAAAHPGDEIGALAWKFRELISHRQAVEVDLQRLAAAVHNTADCIEILDTEGRFLYINPAYERLLSCSRAAVVGKRPEKMKTLAGHEQSYRDMIQSLERGEIWSGTLHSTLSGSLIVEEVTASPIRDSSGKVTAYVSVYRNVNERLAMEQQLRQSQKLEAIGQLAAGVAHEINTPIQYVSMNLRFLEDSFRDLTQLLEVLRKLSSEGESAVPAATIEEALRQADSEYLRVEVPHALEQSRAGIERVSEIVRAMKDFSHPAQEKAAVDLNHSIRNTIALAIAEWKYVAEIRTELDPDLPPVWCVGGQISQAILNIIVNAAHAIGGNSRRPGDPGRITVSTRRQGEWVEIDIADNGCGIAAADLDKIFNPFFTTKPVGKGTGQGLAIAHLTVVKQHGGSITVESEPGRGSLFTIRLPLTPPATAAAAA